MGSIKVLLPVQCEKFKELKDILTILGKYSVNGMSSFTALMLKIVEIFKKKILDYLSCYIIVDLFDEYYHLDDEGGWKMFAIIN